MQPVSYVSCDDSVELPLNERVEYLAIALMHAKSSAIQPEERAPVDFVSDLEDLADVANVQMDIWQAIANSGDSHGMDAEVRIGKVQGLEKGLLTVQEVRALVFLRVSSTKSLKSTAIRRLRSATAAIRVHAFVDQAVGRAR
jgi:hypothetical protein